MNFKINIGEPQYTESQFLRTLKSYYLLRLPREKFTKNYTFLIAINICIYIMPLDLHCQIVSE